MLNMSVCLPLIDVFCTVDNGICMWNSKQGIILFITDGQYFNISLVVALQQDVAITAYNR